MLNNIKTKNIVIQGECGSGKTKLGLEYLINTFKNKENIKIVCICLRIAMLQEILNKIKTIDENIIVSIYSENKKVKENAKVILTTYESINKINEITMNSNIVLLLDEFQLLVEHILSSPLTKDKRLIRFQIIMKLIERSSKSIYIDPYMFDPTIEFIKAISETEIVTLDKTYIKIDYCNLINDSKIFIERYNNCLQEEKRFHLHSDSSEFIKHIYLNFIQPKGRNKYLITGQLKMKNNDELKLLNIKSITDLDYLFTSPCINSCISIENTLIQNIFAIKVSNHININDFMNSLYRIRTLKRINIIDLYPIKKIKNEDRILIKNMTDYQWIEKLNRIYSNITFDEIKSISFIGQINFNNKFLIFDFFNYNINYSILFNFINSNFDRSKDIILTKEDKIKLVNYLISQNILNENKYLETNLAMLTSLLKKNKDNNVKSFKKFISKGFTENQILIPRK